MRVTEPTERCLAYCKKNNRSLYRDRDYIFYISFPTIREAMSHFDEVADLNGDENDRFFGFEVFVTCDAVIRTTRHLERLL